VSETSASALLLAGLTVARGGRPVVTIGVPAGEVTALLGPNGAGKSSLVLAVGGVLRPKPGSVRLDGAELAGRRPERIRAAGLAIVPEGRRLLPDLTVEDNLRVATYALPKKAAAEGAPGRSSCSPGWKSGAAPRPGRCPAASSRC
jgi:branched-chain amino acid transport system ATP-binding protein